MMLYGFKEEHQGKLKSSTALVSGIGGLGGTAALYLAAAGIGRLVLVHSGNLTLSNMNRQVLMKHEWVGKSRVIQAKSTLAEINPDVAVEIYDERMTGQNMLGFLEGVNVTLSARPNYKERRVLNAACIENKVPMVEAAMNGMEGYLFNIIPDVTPCLHCVFPGDDPDWEELGFPVLGAVSGMLGALMSIEAIKILTGYREPLQNKMLSFDTVNMNFKKLSIHKDINCPVCSG